MKKLLSIFLLLALMLATRYADAQVTIGSGKVPSPYSVLELATETIKGGLRLPQLTAAEINTLTTSLDANASGLTVYNSTTDCVEYWNDTKWVSLCKGTASFVLTNSCGGVYEAGNPPLYTADGMYTGCIFTPNDTPPCVVTAGVAYQLSLIAGGSYASMVIEDETLSSFQLFFGSNNTTSQRMAVVRVTNTCTAEFQDFIFIQDGAVCPAGLVDPIIDKSSNVLCQGGSLFAWVTNKQAGTEYIWTLNGTVVGTGVSLELTRAGSYKVYAGLFGCGTPASFIVDPGAETELVAPQIYASNAGILCSGSEVILSTTVQPLAGESLEWYHEGVRITTTTTGSHTITTAAGAGDWYAVLSDGTCHSPASIPITVKDETTAATLADPLATANGASLASPLTVCDGGSVLLNVSNSGTYPPGSTYEWLVNGKRIAYSSNPIVNHTVPTGASGIQFEVRVNTSGGTACPSSLSSESTEINTKAPVASPINGGQTTLICGIGDALLTAGNSSGSSYEWYLNGAVVATTATNQHNVTQPGQYQVRYFDGTCWSALGTRTEVAMSSALSVQWLVSPPDQAIYSSQHSPSITVSPSPASDPNMTIVWTAPGATLVPIPPGLQANILYPPSASVGNTIPIKVVVNNDCGRIELNKDVEVINACSPMTSVRISPTSLTTDNTKSAQNFTAVASEGGDNITYEWFVDGVSKQNGLSPIYSFNPNNAGGGSGPGTFLLTVVATGCSSIAQASSPVTINVNRNVGSITEDATGNYRIEGLTWLDTWQTTTCGPMNLRTDDFQTGGANKANLFDFFYTFTTSLAYTNLAWYVYDETANLLASYSVSGGTVLRTTYRSDIVQYITSNGLQKFTIVAVYNNDAGLERKLTKVVTVADCGGCGWWQDANTWVTAYCWNLDADDSTDPFVPQESNFGNYYQYGIPGTNGTTSKGTILTTKSPAKAIGTTGGLTASQLDIKYNYIPTTWRDEDDPCQLRVLGGAPKGTWRIPTKAELAGLHDNNLNPPVYIGIFYSAGIGAWPTVYRWNGVKFGERLMLPAGGYRVGDSAANDGAMSQVSAYGQYWARERGVYFYFAYTGSATVFNTSTHAPAYSLNIRCVLK